MTEVLEVLPGRCCLVCRKVLQRIRFVSRWASVCFDCQAMHESRRLAAIERAKVGTEARQAIGKDNLQLQVSPAQFAKLERLAKALNVPVATALHRLMEHLP